MLYDDKISEYDCIEIVHPNEENHYIIDEDLFQLLQEYLNNKEN